MIGNAGYMTYVRPDGADGGSRHSPITAHPFVLAPIGSKKRKKNSSYPSPPSSPPQRLAAVTPFVPSLTVMPLCLTATARTI
jgi:hypothetical protein